MLTVTDTRTICCLISSWAHALNLLKSLWYLNVSTLHNSRSTRSLTPRSCSTHRSTLLRVLQYENLRGQYLKQFSWWFQWARWGFLNSCWDQCWFIFCNVIQNNSNKFNLVLPKPLGIQTRIRAERMLNWKQGLWCKSSVLFSSWNKISTVTVCLCLPACLPPSPRTCFNSLANYNGLWQAGRISKTTVVLQLQTDNETERTISFLPWGKEAPF